MYSPTPTTDSAAARLTAVGVLLLIAGCACQSGCVARRMTIRTNPPGALVYIDDYPIGTTPISTDFVYYGKRKVRLVKDGYETMTVMQSVTPPWYQITPLDFVTENLVPGEIRDQRTYNYVLTPQRVVPTGQLLARAEDLRRGISAAGVAPPAAQGGPAWPTPAAPEPIPAPAGVGGQSVYPLPPGRPAPIGP